MMLIIHHKVPMKIAKHIGLALSCGALLLHRQNLMCNVMCNKTLIQQTLAAPQLEQQNMALACFLNLNMVNGHASQQSCTC